MEFEDKFIAFIDILGFKGMVKASESGNGMSLPELIDNLSKLGMQKDENKFELYGPIICPQSIFIQKNLNFKVTQISDCVIISSEISAAGIINLINHCWEAVAGLLMEGIMCRGYITKGSIYHHNNQIIGTGYQEAYSKESDVCAFKLKADDKGTPFVEIDSIVCEYIETSTDQCVREMFSRMVKTESGTTALFPFKLITHSFVIDQEFNSDKEKELNNHVRIKLKWLKEQVMNYVDPANEKAMQKVGYYINAIDEQLLVCDKQDDFIGALCSPLPARKFDYRL